MLGPSAENRAILPVHAFLNNTSQFFSGSPLTVYNSTLVAEYAGVAIGVVTVQLLSLGAVPVGRWYVQ
jgi:hypothetical protein